MTRVTKEQLQENSFKCRICKRYFTEESGAEEGFLCENCGRECPSCNEIVSIKKHGDEGNCKDCIKQLRQQAEEASLSNVLDNIYQSRNPNSLISGIDIEDKIECALWCGSQFEACKDEYIDMGYANESYEGFLVQTYVSTKESFPESIAEELGIDTPDMKQRLERLSKQQ